MMIFAQPATAHSFTVITEVKRKKGEAVLLAGTNIMVHDCFSKLQKY
jgi:hypothetical protein